jgi:hypothetical protein
VEKNAPMVDDVFNVHLAITFAHVHIRIVVFDVNINDQAVVVY